MLAGLRAAASRLAPLAGAEASAACSAASVLGLSALWPGLGLLGSNSTIALFTVVA
jgi:hypothetical protein